MAQFFKYDEWRCFKKTKNVEVDLRAFLNKRLPIFWIIGPPGCGKTTLSEMLAKSSRYHLLTIDVLLTEEVGQKRLHSKVIEAYQSKGRSVPGHIVLDIIKEAFIRTHENCTGYIIDGFPTTLKDAKMFEKHVCRCNMIIYVTLVLDAMLARRVTQVGSFDPNEARISFVRHTKRADGIAKKYEYKTIKVMANYPPEDTCTRLVSHLEDFWGYKFLRLYNKN